MHVKLAFLLLFFCAGGLFSKGFVTVQQVIFLKVSMEDIRGPQ